MVKAVRKPHPASRLAMVNHIDNFIMYFATDAYNVMIEEFIRLEDKDEVSKELMDWFNSSDNDARKIPLIRKTIGAIWEEYNAR